MLKNLFAANFALTPEQRLAVRAALKKWGWIVGVVILVAMVLVGLQNPDPDSGLFFDVVQKAVFGVMRLVMAVVGWFLGIFLGYVAYQAIEASAAGGHATNLDATMEKDVLKPAAVDSRSDAAKLLNRGILLAVLTGLGGLVMALALSGAGGR